MNNCCVKCAVATLATIAIVVAAPAQAQSYPVKAVRVIVPFPAGGGTDLFARAVAQKLSLAMGQQFVVDNRSGAGGLIGCEVVAKAVPDGHTLLITSSSTHSISPHLTRKPAFDAIRDFTPVALIASAANVLVVHPSLPVRSVKDLIALARARPGQMNYASTGSGTLSHLTGELFKLKTGASMVHVPYKGGPPALLDVISGQVSAFFIAVPTASAHIRAGRLRALAVTGQKRVDTLKDVPTVAETIAGFESVQWWGLFAPAGLPAELLVRLNGEVEKIVRDPEVKSRFETEGAEAVGGTPTQFATFFKADYDKWRKVVVDARVRVDQL